MSGIDAKQRTITAAIKARGATGALPCKLKLVVEKDGARSCSTCGARAATTKTILLCGRTGRLPTA